MQDLVSRLRRWTHAVDAAPASDLMDEAANEIVRLRVIVQSYAESSKAASQEIKMLREKLK